MARLAHPVLFGQPDVPRPRFAFDRLDRPPGPNDYCAAEEWVAGNPGPISNQYEFAPRPRPASLVGASPMHLIGSLDPDTGQGARRAHGSPTGRRGNRAGSAPASMGYGGVRWRRTPWVCIAPTRATVQSRALKVIPNVSTSSSGAAEAVPAAATANAPRASTKYVVRIRRVMVPLLSLRSRVT